LSPGSGDSLREHHEWLLSLVPLTEPLSLVDLGCGRGDDLNALAARCTDPATRFVGLDAAAEAVLVAQAAVNSDPRVEIVCERLDGRLPFDDGAVDIVFSNNLLECLGDGPEFVCEVARVLRPGGTAVIGHWDWDTQLFDGADRGLVRRLTQAFADWRQDWMEHADPWAGRRLRGLFESGGLLRGVVHTRTLVESAFTPGSYGYERAHDLEALVAKGTIDAGDYERFLAEQRDLETEGRYFYAVTEFVYVGQRAS
jgi:Methylase involved in ubiquinone/menaquinone biosynthesis